MHPEIVSALRTATHVLDAPAHLVAAIFNRTFYTHSRPAMLHARASSVLGRRIGVPFDGDVSGPHGWWIIFESDLHLEEVVFVPDLAGWRQERMPE